MNLDVRYICLGDLITLSQSDGCLFVNNSNECVVGIYIKKRPPFLKQKI